MLKLIFCLFFSLVAFSAFSNFVENQHSIIEHYFTNPAGKSNFSSYAHKEIYFIKKQKKEGLFDVSIKESFYQLILKPDLNDNLIYLLIEYSDLSFSRDKIIAVGISKVKSNSDNTVYSNETSLLRGLLSSVFYGRSKEFFLILEEDIKNKKITLDLKNSDLTEYFVKKTERQNFEKEHSSDFKNYRKALEETTLLENKVKDSSKVDENPPLHGLVISLLKKRGTGEYALDTGEIKRIKFSNIEKAKVISNLELGFDGSDFRSSYIKANNSTIFIDTKRSSFPSGEYPKKLIFSRDGKMISFTINNVKGYTRSRVSPSSMYKDLKGSGVKTVPFDELIL